MEATIRPAMTDEDRDTLRAFVRLLHRMSESRFIKRIRTEDQTISGQLDENGNPTVTGPNFDWEDFCSFMTDFRKVAINENDRTYFTKILKIVGKYADDEFRKVLKDNRHGAMARLKGHWSGMTVGGEVDGKQVNYNVAELLDAVINGEIFHQGVEHQTAIKFIEQNRQFILLPVIHFKILPVLAMMGGLFHDLWRRNILTTADYPADWQALRMEWDKSKSVSP
jgi:hypothetical protein